MSGGALRMNTGALNSEGVVWANNCIELDFGSTKISKKSIKTEIKSNENKPIQQQPRQVVQSTQIPTFDRSLKPNYDKPAISTGAIPKKISVVLPPKPLPPPAPKRFEEFELLESLLETSGVVFNFEPFECKICFSYVETGEGVTLRDCVHSFCRDCLLQRITHSEEAIVKCPYVDDDYSCDEYLQVKCDTPVFIGNLLFNLFIFNYLVQRNPCHCNERRL